MTNQWENLSKNSVTGGSDNYWSVYVHQEVITGFEKGEGIGIR